ncbi:MAG: SIMPL domain-containing protein [Oscillatoriophycideae cyanobacterium NC_groundwater_1537_Pr4_S-0.65um_50_18]|nr:SIMPL domain-containing protein [Oscillatoriophycideae cyanobacterium NC_groundwater_1537_Pr4_S-0.65um_50_18]
MKSIAVRSGFSIKRACVMPLLLGVLSLSMTNPAFAEGEQMLRTVTVTGMGTESIPTSISQVQLGVEVQGKTAEEVQQEAARRSSAVVELLRSRSVDKLQTAGIYLSPTYDYTDGQQKLTGYTATNSVSFRIATDRAGTLLDDAVKAGATRIDSVSFVAEDSAISTAQKQAIREATQDAQEQAEAALSALGLQRKDIVSIQVNGAAPPMPLYARQERAMAAMADSPAPTPVVGGEQEVQASVTLQISY